MKNEKGITLISLVVTIILIMILAVIGTYNGLEVYENMQVEAFVSKMKVVQEAVNNLCEKYSVQEINSMGENSNEISSEDKQVLSNVISEIQSSISLGETVNSWYPDAGDEIADNYRYFSVENISSILGIKDFDTAIFFNPKSKNIIAVKGVKYNDKMYYRQYDLADGQTLSAPNTDTDFTLDVSVKTFDNKAVIYVNTDQNITELKYIKANDSGNYDDNKSIVSKNLKEITITESGNYKVEAKTVTGSKDIEDGVITKCSEVNIVIVNKPLLVAGMTPIKYNETNEEETTINDNDWYNYGEKKWANAKLKDGSVYVWIPRYAYSIEYTNEEQKSNGGTINIEFMKDNSSLFTTSGKTLSTSYKVMPAFQDGSKTGFVNGEWDSELTGIWVAKYETIAHEVNSKNYPQNTNVHEQSWRNIKPIDAFNICREMEALNNNTYFDDSLLKASGIYEYGTYSNDNNNIDTHIMKNSEWGAAAYLSYSQYGNKNSKLERANSYYVDENISDNYSTTKNIHGIFDFSGASLEMVSAGRQIKEAGFSKENKSTKYATYYDENSKNNIYGDALEETSGWHSCIENYPTEIIARGGCKDNISGISGETGLFAYQNKNLNEENTVSFRPVLIVEYSGKNEIRGNSAIIAQNSNNIGKMVNYGVSYTDVSVETGQPDSGWQILYADNKNVYVITKGVLGASDLSQAIASESGYNGTSDFLNLNKQKYLAIADGWLNKICENGNILFNSDNSNVKCSEYILDNTNPKWSSLKNDKAKWVIGGPTLELLVASYNAININNKVVIENIQSTGYQQTLGNNTLQNLSERPWNHGQNYWLACPSDTSNSTICALESSDNCVGGYNYDYSTYFRPVICLNSDVVLTWNESENAYDLSEK